MAGICEYHFALEYLSVFDEIQHTFADAMNPTKHAGYDGIATLEHCMQGIPVKNSDASWIEIEHFRPGAD